MEQMTSTVCGQNDPINGHLIEPPYHEGGDLDPIKKDEVRTAVD